MSTASIAIKEMSHEEKLRTMEELWDELCRAPEGVPSPAWHEEVLEARRQRVARGEAKFFPLEEVKARLLAPRK